MVLMKRSLRVPSSSSNTKRGQLGGSGVAGVGVGAAARAPRRHVGLGRAGSASSVATFSGSLVSARLVSLLGAVTSGRGAGVRRAVARPRPLRVGAALTGAGSVRSAGVAFGEGAGRGGVRAA